MAGGGGNEPNLTPFIDLFSVLICFLLMTAAWLQLESLQTNIDVPKHSSESTTTEEPPPADEKKITLSVTVSQDKVVLKENDQEENVPRSGPIQRNIVLEKLQSWKGKYPNKRDVVLSTESSAVYGDMITMYDLLIEADFPDVGLNPN
jgi:biopolymer transport protein ExbD